MGDQSRPHCSPQPRSRTHESYVEEGVRLLVGRDSASLEIGLGGVSSVWSESAVRKGCEVDPL